MGRDPKFSQGDASDLAPLYIGDVNIVGVTYTVSGAFAGQIEVHMDKYPVPFMLAFVSDGVSYSQSFPALGGGLAYNASQAIFTLDKIESDTAKKAILDDIFGDYILRSGQTMRIDLTA